MAGKKGWVRVEDGKEHPENSILLTYTRKQQLEDRLGIRRHIDQCSRCLDKCAEFEHDSIELGTLKQMQAHLDYSDVPPALLMARIESKYAKYERSFSGHARRRIEHVQQEVARSARLLKPERPVSFVSFHALLALIILTALLVGGIVLAFQALHGEEGQFILNHGLFPVNQPTLALLQQHQATATINPGSRGAQSPTTAGSGQSKEHITVCTTDQDRAASRLRICGSNFQPGDKVALLITMAGSDQPKQHHPVMVDGRGEFQVTISIYNCNVPLAIQAHDMTNITVYSNMLQHIKFAGCRIPSPNFGAGSKKP
jgi:hypothetical protein